MASDKRLDQVKLVNSAESVLVVNGDQVEKAALAGFANSMGSSVPLQQTSEQVAITGLYARTSDGKMVELTKESVASVVAGVMNTNKVFPSMMMGAIPNNDCNNAVETGTYFYYIEQGGLDNSPGLSRFVMDVKTNAGGTYQVAYSTGLSDSEQMRQVLYRSCLNDIWLPWQRIDNFGYNTLAELSSGVAQQIGPMTRAREVYGGDFNDLDTSGFYFYNRFDKDSVVNAPEANYGHVMVLGFGTLVSQVAFVAGATPNIFSRSNYGNGWSNWTALN